MAKDENGRDWVLRSINGQEILCVWIGDDENPHKPWKNNKILHPNDTHMLIRREWAKAVQTLIDKQMNKGKKNAKKIAGKDQDSVELPGQTWRKGEKIFSKRPDKEAILTLFKHKLGYPEATLDFLNNTSAGVSSKTFVIVPAPGCSLKLQITNTGKRGVQGKQWMGVTHQILLDQYDDAIRQLHKEDRELEFFKRDQELRRNTIKETKVDIEDFEKKVKRTLSGRNSIPTQKIDQNEKENGLRKMKTVLGNTDLVYRIQKKIDVDHGILTDIEGVKAKQGLAQKLIAPGEKTQKETLEDLRELHHITLANWMEDRLTKSDQLSYLKSYNTEEQKMRMIEQAESSLKGLIMPMALELEYDKLNKAKFEKWKKAQNQQEQKKTDQQLRIGPFTILQRSTPIKKDGNKLEAKTKENTDKRDRSPRDSEDAPVGKRTEESKREGQKGEETKTKERAENGDRSVSGEEHEDSNRKSKVR